MKPRTWFRPSSASQGISRSRHAASNRTRRWQPTVELLEDRMLLSTYIVNTTSDEMDGGTLANPAGPDGILSLREAITVANLNSGKDTINFNIGGGGVQTIALTSALPTITDAVIIDATTQTGFSGTPLIELNGASAGSGANGLNITAGNSTVRGLVINRFGQNGIFLTSGGGNVIAGNYLGTDVSGALNRGNVFSGVQIQSSNSNTIGGTTAADRNVLSGNGGANNGGNVSIQDGNNNLVQGNLIGTNAAGTAVVSVPPNRCFGVVIQGSSSGNVIGGTTAAARNIISGNTKAGIGVAFGPTGNFFQGNYIGTDISGTFAVGNRTNGILIQSANGNTVGGTAAGAGNVISGNGFNQAGAVNILNASNNVVQGNFIGTNAAGTAAIANIGGGAGVAIQTQIGFTASGNLIGGTSLAARNVISGNSVEAGVWLQGAGVTGNFVQGNYIGTNGAGTAALANTGYGVRLAPTTTSNTGANNNTIGGTAAGAGNVIAGNTKSGIIITNNLVPTGSGNGSGTSGNLVYGNFIGTDATGLLHLGNGQAGVDVINATLNSIGDDAAGAGNTIAFNASDGVRLQQHSTSITIHGNSIHDNAGLGINLDGDGNNLLPSSSITAAYAGAQTQVSGNLSGLADGTYVLDFFASAITQFGADMIAEGSRYLGSVTVTKNGSNPTGNFTSVPLTASNPGEALTGTATDAAGNTSQFSAGFALTDLLILGTSGADNIQVLPGTQSGTIKVINGATTTDNLTVGGQVRILAGAGNDTITVSATGAQGLVVDGQDGSETYVINLGNLAGTVTLADSGTSGTDSLMINGAPGDNYIVKTATQVTWGSPSTETINYSGIENLTVIGGSGTNTIIDPGNVTTTIIGGPGDNNIVITSSGGDGVTVQGGGGVNTYTVNLGGLAAPVLIQNSNVGATNNLILSGAPGNNTITASGNQVTSGTRSITDTASLANLTINGGSGDNQITVAPLTISVQSLTLNGSEGNDTIAVSASVTIPTTITSGGGTDSLQGGGGTNSLVGGSGNTTFFDNGGTNTVVGGTGGNTFIAGSGHTTFQTPPGSPTPIVFNDNYTTDSVLNVAAAGVLANDLSVNGQPITAVLAGGPGHGSLTLNADGSFKYTPTAGFIGADSFTYQAKGSDGALSAVAVVSLRVNYNFSGFLPPLANNLAFNQNRTIPIKWQLKDAAGNVLTSLSSVTSLQVAPVLSGGLGTPFNPTPTGSTSLRNDGSQYIFNWDTKNVAVGSYRILLTLADGTVQTKTLQIVTKGGSSGLLVDGTSGASTVNGGLLAGDIALYVDNASGLLTGDELARIDSAVAVVDAVIGAYGVTITEVGDSASSNVVLDMASTSAVGSYADGVLGCTSDGEITLIQGWNWYAGSDVTHIGAAQYDFETVVVHELGHALGLGHSAVAGSVMYPTLNAGAVNRGMTTADLNVSDGDSGSDGLHAAVPALALTNDAPRDIIATAGLNAGSISGRDLLLALLGGEAKRGGGMEPFVPSFASRKAVFAGMADQDNARSTSRDLFFAGQAPREEADEWLEVRLFPDPSQEQSADDIAPDASSGDAAPYLWSANVNDGA